MARRGILTLDDGPAVRTLNQRGISPFLLVCEHASNRIPEALNGLGVDRDVLESHAAWDPGAMAIAAGMSDRLDAHLISAEFSRLVYDLNRPPSSPEAMRTTSEIHYIPGNADISEKERQVRIDALYHPFHNTVWAAIASRKARGQETVLVTIHTFTPAYFGEPRSVELGILHDRDGRLADALLAAAARSTQLRTERNQPYGPDDDVTHTLIKHALPDNLLNAMIEIRNDLVADEKGQRQIADLLAEMLTDALEQVRASMSLSATAEMPGHRI